MTGQIPRVRIEIDGHSFLETFPDKRAGTLIVFIHGIFGNPKTTWAETPHTFMMLPVLADADWSSFGYKTGIIYRRDARQVVDQLLLWLRTHTNQYQNIFLIGHSMGGLFIRDLCAQLALSDARSDQYLLAKIKHGFLVACPIGGAALAQTLSNIPLLGKLSALNTHWTYLEQGKKYASEFPQFKAAIESAKARSIPTPRFSIFTGTEDRVVESIVRSTLIDDDTYEGPVPGDHSTLKAGLNPNSTLVKRIVQIISDYLNPSTTQALTTNAATIAADASASTEGISQRPTAEGSPIDLDQRRARQNRRPIILISCSAHKRTDGEGPHPKTGGLLAAVEESEVALRSIRTRVQIMGLLQSARIDGTEFKEGNRAGRPENRALAFGPDFGGAINEPNYLPAYWRYHGRTYQAKIEDWTNYREFPESIRPSILIMSGLYGLIPFDEYIQNYDCHITDTDLATGKTVLSYWGPTMTDVVLSHCDRLETSGASVGPVIDLLSERSYQSAIDWSRIYPRCTVLHRVFQNKSDRDALVNIGVFLRTLLRDPEKASRLLPDRFYDEAEFIDSDRIAFETSIGGSTLPIARS